jgi:hypothetical protein
MSFWPRLLFILDLARTDSPALEAARGGVECKAVINFKEHVDFSRH